MQAGKSEAPCKTITTLQIEDLPANNFTSIACWQIKDYYFQWNFGLLTSVFRPVKSRIPFFRGKTINTLFFLIIASY